ncbi:hypothetical protein PMIN02_006309 [Paraphaeosphaeria minitans]
MLIGVAVESRSGNVYCGDCQDFIYDPLLEERRLQKGKKRKYEDLTTTEEHKLVLNNSTFLPCRAIGLRGLYNMGQTCFMSVILQTLIHNPFVRNFYLSEGHKTVDCERESCVSCALDEMFVEFHSVEKTEGYGAVNMLMGSWLAGEALAGYQQQDAHEYMQFMLNTLHLQNGGSTDTEDCDCMVHQTFYGRLSSTVTCDNCRNTTTALDPYMDLSLDIRNLPKRKKAERSDNDHIALQSCLDRFTGREKLGAAEYTCQTCDGGQNATKQLSIKQLPPVLPIHLKVYRIPLSTTHFSSFTCTNVHSSASSTPSPPPPSSKPASPSPSPWTCIPTPQHTALAPPYPLNTPSRPTPRTTPTARRTLSSTSSPASSCTRERSTRDIISAIAGKGMTGSCSTIVRWCSRARRRCWARRRICCFTWCSVWRCKWY